ncbi:hypothetical protein MNBD_GAMMA13-400 [hydrothermal vent metagenome]|uniref:Uncharacterized protein n=1 Tax=hydrothermal vent metagenome TaxID=652676 RepID=A0A3B0Y6L5_9ZZZZ
MKIIERLAIKFPCTSMKCYSGVAAAVVTLLISGVTVAEPEGNNNYSKQTVTTEALVANSQPLNVNAIPIVPATELAAVSESEATSPTAPMKLALADHHETGVAIEQQGAFDATSPRGLIGRESAQMPVALILALLALITVVPMSRRR